VTRVRRAMQAETANCAPTPHASANVFIAPTYEPAFNLFRSGLPASAVGTANARLGQLWLDALAAERGAAARTLQTYRDDLAMAALQLTAVT